MPDAIEDIVDFSLSLRWEDLPDSTRMRARRALADTLATAIAGETAEGVDALRAQLVHWGGREEATTIGWADLLPGPAAAWLNAMMARARDFDDCDDETGDHPSVATVPAVLAATETMGVDHLSSALLGIVAGTEFVLRLRRASDERLSAALPWTTGTYSPLSGVIAAAKAVGADRQTTLNAVGIAYTEMSNTSQSQREGTLAHRIHQGSAVASALSALMFAGRGMTGIRGVIEGPFGVFRAYMNGSGEAARLMRRTGEGLLLDQVSIKPYPSCRLTHGPVQGILRLTDGKALPPESIEAVRVSVNRCASLLCGRPWSTHETSVAAQFSLRYIVATALLNGSITVEHFAPDRVCDPIVADVASRVEVVHDPALDANGAQVGPSAVSLRLADGGEESTEVPFAYGHPLNPVGDDEFAAKLDVCAHSPGRSPARADEAAAALRGLLATEADGPFLHVLSGLARDEYPAVPPTTPSAATAAG